MTTRSRWVGENASPDYLLWEAWHHPSGIPEWRGSNPRPLRTLAPTCLAKHSWVATLDFDLHCSLLNCFLIDTERGQRRRMIGVGRGQRSMIGVERG